MERVENEPEEESQELELIREVGSWGKKWPLMSKQESGIIRCVFQCTVKNEFKMIKNIK